MGRGLQFRILIFLLAASSAFGGMSGPEIFLGLSLASATLERRVVEGATYWFDAGMEPIGEASTTAHLLPNFDEYTVGYADRSAVWDEAHNVKLGARNNVLFNHTILLDGQIVGAVGVSGANNADEDQALALAGAAANRTVAIGFMTRGSFRLVADGPTKTSTLQHTLVPFKLNTL